MPPRQLPALEDREDLVKRIVSGFGDVDPHWPPGAADGAFRAPALPALRRGDRAARDRGRLAGGRRAAGACLARAGIAEPAYADEMIRMIEEHGPYVVIAPGLALAHARPGPEVLKDGLAVVTLSTPVTFGHPYNDPVNVVLALAVHSSEPTSRSSRNSPTCSTTLWIAAQPRSPTPSGRQVRAILGAAAPEPHPSSRLDRSSPYARDQLPHSRIQRCDRRVGRGIRSARSPLEGVDVPLSFGSVPLGRTTIVRRPPGCAGCRPAGSRRSPGRSRRCGRPHAADLLGGAARSRDMIRGISGRS